MDALALLAVCAALASRPLALGAGACPLRPAAGLAWALALGAAQALWVTAGGWLAGAAGRMGVTAVATLGEGGVQGALILSALAAGALWAACGAQLLAGDGGPASVETYRGLRGLGAVALAGQADGLAAGAGLGLVGAPWLAAGLLAGLVAAVAAAAGIAAWRHRPRLRAARWLGGAVLCLLGAGELWLGLMAL